MSETRRLKNLFSRSKVASEIDAELQSHIEMRIEDNVAAGMSLAEARRDAEIRFGNRVATKERVLGEDVALVVESIGHDARFAVRQLVRNPGFAVTAILVMAMGIGASVAMFAFVDAALIKPLPYDKPNQLMDVTETAAVFGRANLSYLDFLDWKRADSDLQSFEVYRSTGFLLGMGKGAEPVPSEYVSAGFFKTLGIRPLLGRDFKIDEDHPEAARTALLSYGAWQHRFGGRRDVVGQIVTLSSEPVTIIGVLPETFQFVPRGNAEFWLPLQITANSSCEKRRSCHSLNGIGRLKDGVTRAQALRQFTSIAANLERQYPDSNRGQGASVIPLSEVFLGDIRPILLALLGGASLLLVIACVNVSSLLLVRSENRRREVSLRGALGASRGRLLRQFVIEGFLLVFAGGALGLGAAYVAVQVLLRLIQKDMLVSMPYLVGLGLNLHVLAFSAVVCGGSAVLFSATPLLRLVAGGGLRDGMSEGSRGSSGTIWRKFGTHLVALELAIAVVLLVAAGLLGKSFFRLLHVDLGFVPEHVATMQLVLPKKQYDDDNKQRAAAQEIMARFSALPGVKSVGLTSLLVLNGNGNTDWIRFVGRSYDGRHNEVNQREVSGAYLSTLGVKLVRGRFFTDEEDMTKPNVVLINRALARKYYPGEDPIGKRIGDTQLTPQSIKEIVGIVDDVREAGLDQEIWPAIYDPFNQAPDTYMTLVVRTAADEKALLPTLVATVHSIDPGIGISDETTMAAKISESSAAYLHRSAAYLVGGFAGLALVLSVVGLYGVIAYSVSQRTREIGVRMALGAARSSVSGLILKEAARLIAIGLIVGLACSVATAALGRKLLFGTQAWDVGTLAGVALVLGVSAMMASWLPARRAASVNPVEALRAE
jgi:macrolide transport system ATP-binding/permease protein